MKNFGYIFNADICIFSLIKQKNELFSITYLWIILQKNVI